MSTHNKEKYLFFKKNSQTNLILRMNEERQSGHGKKVSFVNRKFIRIKFSYNRNSKQYYRKGKSYLVL